MLGKKNIKILLSSAFSIFIISGCSTTVNTGLTPNTDNKATENNNTGNTSNNSTVFEQKEVAGLKFNKVSEKNASLLNNQGGATNAPGANPVAPTAGGDSGNGSVRSSAPASESASGPVGKSTLAVPQSAIAPSADIAIAPFSKMAYPYYGYFPAPGAFEEYVMVDYEEAKADGFTGTYLETLNKKVKPVISAWSSDARHTSSNGSTDNNGLNKSLDSSQEGSPYYYSPYQWQYTYASASKKEVYSIFVSTKETLVLRQKWALKDLDPDQIKIDSNQAIKIITDKISDKSYQSPDMPKDQPNYYGPNAEILYSIPANGTWSFYLNQEKSDIVWNINLNVYNNPPIAVARDVQVGIATPDIATSGGGSAGAAPSMTQPMINTWYSGGYARINARTGEILSLNRPVKYTEKYYPYTPPVKCDGQGNCYSEGSTGEKPPAPDVPQPLPAPETPKPVTIL